MKTVLQQLKYKVFIIIALMSLAAFSQQGINYQGIARDANGGLLTDTEITLELSILKSTVDGGVIYGEIDTVMTDVNGVFSLVIGNGQPVKGVFTDIDWAEDKHFLSVALNGTAIGVTEFMGVPYAQALGKWQAHKNGVTAKGTGGSIYVGENAGENDNFTDNHNIGLGENALQRNSEGSDNIALGLESLRFNILGIQNTAIGNQALFNNSEGHRNTAIGKSALFSNTNGSNNIANGYTALYTNTSGSNNMANGYRALYNNTEGENNIANGYTALYTNTSGSNNIASGYQALFNSNVGNSNIALGYSTLFSNTEGNSNIAIGTMALHSNTTGSSNIANGYNALSKNTEGDFNIAQGHYALFSNTTGSNNVANGKGALSRNINGSNNIANGSAALSRNVTGSSNIANGLEALFNNTEGHDNIASGARALYSNVGGGNNIAFGNSSLTSNKYANYNIAIGTNSMKDKTFGNSNVAIGFAAAESNTTGSYNVGVGDLTLHSNITGSGNVAIGRSAGRLSLGSNNVFIGYKAGYNETGSNKLYINNDISEYPLIYGDFETSEVSFNANVGIGIKEPATSLHVRFGNDANLDSGSGYLLLGEEAYNNLVLDSNEIQARENGVASTLFLQKEGGSLKIGGEVYVDNSIVHASDKRLKRDIEDISYGLKEILQLQPAQYYWKGKTQDYKSLGLIAQDVEEVIKNIVTYNKDIDRYGVSYIELIPVLIKAIQDQQKIIDSQIKINQEKESQLKVFETRLSALEASHKSNLN